MPEGCGVRIEVQHRQNAAMTMATGKMPAPGTVERIVMLLYADDMVLMSHKPEELAVMLQAMDSVAALYGLSINAAKTEIQVQWPVAGEVRGASAQCDLVRGRCEGCRRLQVPRQLGTAGLGYEQGD